MCFGFSFALAFASGRAFFRLLRLLCLEPWTGQEKWFHSPPFFSALGWSEEEAWGYPTMRLVWVSDAVGSVGFCALPSRPCAVGDEASDDLEYRVTGRRRVWALGLHVILRTRCGVGATSRPLWDLTPPRFGATEPVHHCSWLCPSFFLLLFFSFPGFTVCTGFLWAFIFLFILSFRFFGSPCLFLQFLLIFSLSSFFNTCLFFLHIAYFSYSSAIFLYIFNISEMYD